MNRVPRIIGSSAVRDTHSPFRGPCQKLADLTPANLLENRRCRRRSAQVCRIQPARMCRCAPAAGESRAPGDTLRLRQPPVVRDAFRLRPLRSPWECRIQMERAYKRLHCLSAATAAVTQNQILLDDHPARLSPLPFGCDRCGHEADLNGPGGAQRVSTAFRLRPLRSRVPGGRFLVSRETSPLPFGCDRCGHPASGAHMAWTNSGSPLPFGCDRCGHENEESQMAL